VDNAKLNAANDAVVNPANGQIVCQVSLTSFANLYPGCVPMNPFGYGATTRAMAQYIDVDTWNDQINTMDDAGGSIAGSLFNLPAGPVRVALSGEWRNLGYTVHSDFRPTDVVDCTGLRLCTANIPRYWLNTVAPVNTSEHVWEAAIEANVPLLKDMPLVEELTLNLADRITDYSVSGQVSTWKVGADYHINSQIRIRGTASVDIRAPTLTDLFQPITRSSTGYTDIHTGVGLSTQTQSQGNPKLVPEVARTYTAGVVLTPQALSNFNIALDYYQITLNNSIGTLNAGNTQVQQLCEAANGSGPICALYQRPLPFSDRTAANYPTLILSQGLNASYQAIRGWDLEANYRFDMAKFFSKTPGSVSLRLLGNYQPYNTTIQFLGATPTYVAAPKTRITGTAAYTVGEWRFNAVDRWYSSYNQATSDGQIYANPTVPAFMVVDLGVSREFKAWNRGVTAYFQVDNVFDPKPPITGGGSANPGFASAINAIYPVLGRTFTVGVRGKF
jgi:outer membrane receptor protein involved in Fe transport